MCKQMIRLSNISVSYFTKYQKVEALAEFNMNIEKGEYVAIIGKSGSGKSTILNSIAGYVIPQDGEVYVDGKSLKQLSPIELCAYHNKTIGYVFQSFNLIYQFTVLENVLVPMLIAGSTRVDAEKSAMSLLEKMHLTSKAHQFPNELSGGEQQRVGIARALVNNPDIILADEPTGNLDDNTSKDIMDIFDTIHSAGKTIVMVTHDTNIASRAERIIEI